MTSAKTLIVCTAVLAVLGACSKGSPSAEKTASLHFIVRDTSNGPPHRAELSCGSKAEGRGYLADPSGVALTDLLDAQGIPLVHVHTSGHASVPDLRRLVDAVDPKRVVPIHSEAAARFGVLFPRVECHDDGSWWCV